MLRTLLGDPSRIVALELTRLLDTRDDRMIGYYQYPVLPHLTSDELLLHCKSYLTAFLFVDDLFALCTLTAYTQHRAITIYIA